MTKENHPETIPYKMGQQAYGRRMSRDSNPFSATFGNYRSQWFAGYDDERVSEKEWDEYMQDLGVRQ